MHKIRSRVTDNFTGLMEDIIKANGKMANSTEKAYILMLTM